MIEYVVASIDQLILGKVVGAEAPTPNFPDNVFFTVIFNVKVAEGESDFTT